MAVGTGLAIAGGLLGAYGSKKQADAQSSAARAAAQAAQFNPWNFVAPGGVADFSQGYGNLMLDSRGQQTRNVLERGALGLFQGQGPNAGFADQFRGLGGGVLPGLFGSALNVADPSMAGLQGQLNPLFAQVGGLTQGAPGVGGLFSQAANFAGQTSFDPSGMVSDRLGLLRQQAAPFEEQQFNTLQNRLFSQGRLGSTGGSRDIEAFARGLGQADLGRQLEAQQLGLQAQGQSANILAQQAGLFGNLGTALGQQQLQGFGQQAGIADTLFRSGFGVNEAVNQRALQRLAAAQGLFGFGQDLSNQDFNRGLSSLQGVQSIDANLRNLAGMGVQAGGAGAAAGGNVAQALLQGGGSPTGAFLGSLGTGLFGQAINPAAAFAPKTTPTTDVYRGIPALSGFLGGMF